MKKFATAALLTVFICQSASAQNQPQVMCSKGTVGNNMQQGAANAANGDMASADGVFNAMNDALKKANSLCYDAMRSMNVSSAIPPLPLPSAVGPAVGTFMSNVINKTFSNACDKVVTTATGAINQTSSQSVVLPGGAGRLSVGDAANTIRTGNYQGAAANASQNVSNSASNQVVGTVNNQVNSSVNNATGSRSSNLWK